MLLNIHPRHQGHHRRGGDRVGQDVRLPHPAAGLDPVAAQADGDRGGGPGPVRHHHGAHQASDQSESFTFLNSDQSEGFF